MRLGNREPEKRSGSGKGNLFPTAYSNCALTVVGILLARRFNVRVWVAFCTFLYWIVSRCTTHGPFLYKGRVWAIKEAIHHCSIDARDISLRPKTHTNEKTVTPMRKNATGTEEPPKCCNRVRAMIGPRPPAKGAESW